eukprot:gene3139-5455_t
MQAVILATLFPIKKIFLLEKRKEHIRNHGLRIWHSTVESIQNILESIFKKVDIMTGSIENKEEKLYYQKVLTNIKKTKEFLKKNFLDAPGFLGPFISTKKISNLLQSYAVKIGESNQKDLKLDENKVELKQGKQYEFKFEHLNTKEEQKESIEEKNEKSLEEIIYIENQEFHEEKKEEMVDKEYLDTSEVKKIIKNSSIIFSAEGSHSSIRKFIIGDEFPEETVIQYLIEIKLHVKPNDQTTNISNDNDEDAYNSSKKKKVSSIGSSLNSSIEASEFVTETVDHMVKPLITTGKVHVWNKAKDGTATLHILVQKDVFDAMTSKTNSKGNMGGFANPYNRIRQLPYEADTRKLIKNGLIDVIGLDNFDHDSLKITTIPMKIYFSKELMKIQDEKLFILVGDAACGLIFIEGANNAIHTGVHYGEGLMNFFLNQKISVDELKSFNFEKTNGIPSELNESYDKIKNRYNEAQKRIVFKKKAIEKSEKIARSVSKSKRSKRSSVNDDFHEINQKSIFFQQLKSIDLVLDKLAIDQTFAPSIHLFDSFINDLEQEGNHIEERSKHSISADHLTKLMKSTENLISFLLTNDKEKNIKEIEKFEKENERLTMKDSTTFLILTSLTATNLTENMKQLTKTLLFILSE